jgi:bifunctional enzyme CysN/CysC
MDALARRFEVPADAALPLQAVQAAAEADTLRLLTCGSVDDGKSTLIGRLLYDSQLLMEDQLAELERDSARHGTTGGIDFALLVDGLEAEREQGITIDVAYRFFATPRRRFIVADTPGHVQYTRNMATGASTADAAVLLVDASKGLLTQTRRHALIASLMGIRQVVLAVNKMDLVGFDRDRFEAIAADFAAFAKDIGVASVQAVPISARDGDNVTGPSPRMPWFDGPALLPCLEALPAASSPQEAPLRFAVQWVCRPDATFRGFAGWVASGRLAVGDPIVVAGSGRTSRVARILLGRQELGHAFAGQSVMIVLADEVDVSRGDVLAAPEARPELSDQFAAHLVWMGEEHLLPGRQYLLKCGAQTVPAQVTELKWRLDPDHLEHSAAKVLELNEIGFCNLATDQRIAFDPYDFGRDGGSFILIDRFTNATVAAGMIRFSLRRAANIHWQALEVDRAARARAKRQQPAVLWFTGLSGSGKSTIANLVEKKLFGRGAHTALLDGDNVRHGLNRDLGFTDADRVENIRRVAEAARLMTDAGLIVLVSFISPFRSERDMARRLMPEGEFAEIFVDTPIEVCRARDPKGLYARAIRGEIKNFTGIDSPYERPERPELSLDTTAEAAEALAERVVAWLEASGRLTPA